MRGKIMGGRGSGQHANHYCKYQVAEVRDGEGLPVYVTTQRVGEPFVEMAWSCRNRVDNPLMRWLRTLDTPPKTRVLLGSTLQLPRRAAWQLMRFRRDEVARMAGSWPDVPDFALWLPVNRGGSRHRRPICRVWGDVVERFASVEEAARAIQSSPDDIDDRVESGHQDGAGWAWWDCRPQNSDTPNRAWEAPPLRFGIMWLFGNRHGGPSPGPCCPKHFENVCDSRFAYERPNEPCGAP
jgi:hypothetical protein